jgi:hypothetical protein
MAYVRKTETLVNGITSTVRAMRSKAQQPFRTKDIESGTPEYDALSSAIEPAAWRIAPELRDQMPSEWKSEVEHINVDVRVDGERQIYQRISNSKSPFLLPPSFKSGGYYSASDLMMSGLDVPPIILKWINEKADKQKKYEAVTEKFQTIETKLQMFMQQHASLNTALKDLPDLELYVPDEFMQKIREASTPRAKTATEERPVYESLGLDADELSALAVGHRVSMASS